MHQDLWGGRQQLVDDETREPVEAHEKGRGYEYAKGSFLMIEDHELEAIGDREQPHDRNRLVRASR